MAFFPNFLKRRYQLKKQAEQRTPFPQDHIPECVVILEESKKDKDFFEPYFFLNEYDLHEDKISEELYEIATNRRLRKVLQWICQHVLFTIHKDKFMSVEVFIRIGTSMLNKLEYENIISKRLNIYYHDNFVRNTADLLIQMNEESLPF